MTILAPRMQKSSKATERTSSDSQNVDISLSSDRYDLGDLVGGTDPVTGIRATATVTKKVLSLSGTVPTVSYETTLR